jgi:hypothetical protein
VNIEFLQHPRASEGRSRVRWSATGSGSSAGAGAVGVLDPSGVLGSGAGAGLSLGDGPLRAGDELGLGGDRRRPNYLEQTDQLRITEVLVCMEPARRIAPTGSPTSLAAALTARETRPAGHCLDQDCSAYGALFRASTAPIIARGRQGRRSA